MKNKRIGIMGGTFDPIHFGHLVIANEVLNIYNLEKIIFIPAGNPPHKNGIGASSYDRYLMTNLAIVTNDKFTVSDIEINKPGKSYTLNTIVELQKQYNNTEFYFITGMDAIIEIPTWYKPETLLKLCKFIAVSRPGNNKNEVELKINEIKEKYKANIEILQVPMLQISSTDIRQRFKYGKTSKYLLPEIVEQYIIKNNIYALNNNDIEQIKIKLKSFTTSKVFNHCVKTMEEAEKLAVKYNEDINKSKLAGLLHDCAKSKKAGDNISHSKDGAELAKDFFNIYDENVLNAIKYHTTGKESMNTLEKIIFIADKIEQSRNYEGVEELRKIAYEDLDKAIVKSLENTINYVKKRNLELDEESLKALKYLKKGGKI